MCELTLDQLRNNRETLLNVLSTMRHDPLVEWSKRNSREDASGARDSEEATRELGKINQKLQGVMQLRGPTPLSVQGQVQQLINDATDLSNLGQMYIWWMVRDVAHRIRHVVISCVIPHVLCIAAVVLT